MAQIDWDESAENGRVCVRAHVDEELDELKHLYNGIDEVLVSHAMFQNVFMLKESIAGQRRRTNLRQCTF